jgi:very-short-patch-repair endonuclease
MQSDCRMDIQTATGFADIRCAFVARRQYGVISRRQALDAGMTPTMIQRRLASKRWELIYPGVYRIAGAPTSQQQNAMAVCLWGGADTFLAFRTAAAGWGLEGGRWNPPELICPRRLSARKSIAVVHKSASIGPADVTFLGALPISTPTRTLIDLSALLGERSLELGLDQALRTGKATVEGPSARLAELAPTRLPGLRTLRDLVAQRDPDLRIKPTELETLTNRWIRRFGFPAPVFQHWVSLPHYGPARLDFAYPSQLVGVEADSFEWHTGREAFERDRIRGNEFAALGWIIIRTTYRELETHPERPARALRSALDERDAIWMSI